MMRALPSALLAGIILFGGIARGQGEDEPLLTDLPLGDETEESARQPAVSPSDPLELFNRAMYHVNDKLYSWVIKPAAKGYKKAVPKNPRRGIRNAFKNVATPVRLVNCTLQGDLQGTATEVSRFVINTTLGGLGFSDPAKKHFGIRVREEDTGQTLGAYGVGSGPFLMLPVFGPLTIRDGVGKIGDWFLDPLNWLDLETLEEIGIKAEEIVNNTSLRLGQYEALKKSAVDPYIAIRNGYLKKRQKDVSRRGEKRPDPASGTPASGTTP